MCDLHSLQLRDVMAAEIAKNGEVVRLDVLTWISKTTLDIIGLAGFNYAFNALDPNGRVDELSEAFSDIFSASHNSRFLNMLQAFIPPLRLIVSRRPLRHLHRR